MERVRIVPGRVVEGKVEVQTAPDVWAPAEDVVILGAGLGDSAGFVLVGQSVSHYITNTQVDAAFMLAKVGELAGMLADLGNVNTWANPSTTGTGPNAAAQAVATQAEALQNEIREHKLK